MSRQEKLAALASTGVTKAELDNIDGGTARGTTAIADGDGVLINDAGTMRMTSVETMATYMGTKVGGLKEFIVSSGSISNAATQAFTQFDSSKYVHYLFEFRLVIPATDNVLLQVRTSSNGGSSYDSGSDNYHNFGNTTDVNVIDPFGTNTFGSDSGELGASLDIECRLPHVTSSYTYIISSGGVGQDPNSRIYSNNYVTYGGSRQATANVNAIQFFFSSGNIESGEIRMYGIKDS
jgi:hypothetical protein